MERYFMKGNSTRKIYQEWFEKAEEDLAVIRAILSEDAPPSAACFHAQQAAEKFLKALIAYREKSPRKIHDLVRLARLLQDTDRGILDFKTELALLNRFYIRTRYPAHIPEFSKKDAKEAADIAERVGKFVSAQLF